MKGARMMVQYSTGVLRRSARGAALLCMPLFILLAACGSDGDDSGNGDVDGDATPTAAAQPTAGPTGPISGDGSEMRLTLKEGGTCEGNNCQVAPGGSFTIGVEVVRAPEAGYIQVSSSISFGSDLTYLMTEEATAEFTWPDVSESVALRAQPEEGVINHGGLTSIVPPFITSTYTGNVLELAFQCSENESTTDVQLLPEGDPVAGPFGALFLEPDTITQIRPAVSGLTIECVAGDTAMTGPSVGL